MWIGTTGGCRIFQILHNGMFYLVGENVHLEKGPHHAFKINFPFGAVGLGFSLVFVPGEQVCKFVYGSYQESIGIEVVIDGNAVALPGIGRAVISIFRISAAGNLELTLKMVNPPGN
jgi:hypothetical protein